MNNDKKNNKSNDKSRKVMNKNNNGKIGGKPIKNKIKRKSNNINDEKKSSWEVPKPSNQNQKKLPPPNKRNLKSNGRPTNVNSDKSRDRGGKPKKPYTKIRVYNQEDLVSNDLRVKNKHKRADSRVIFYTAIVSFIILIYFGSNVYRFLAKDNIASMKLNKVTIDTPKVYNGLIVRDEELYTATTTGEIDYKIANDEKAKNGELICVLVDSSFEAITTDISSEEFTKASQQFDSDVTNINDRIKSEFDYNKIDDLNKAYIYAEKIYESMEIRNQIILSQLNSSNDGENKSAVKESFHTKQSGVINYNIDGYELVYNMENIDNIVEKDIEEALKVSQPVRNKMVESGEVVFKTIKSNSWYIVMYIDNSEITLRNIQVNKNIEIYVNKMNLYLPILANVESVTAGEKTSKVVLKCNSFMSEYTDDRTLLVKLAEENVEGYKIPKTAIEQKETIVINSDFVYLNEKEGYEYVVKEGYDGENYEIPIEKYNVRDLYTYVLKSNTELKKGDVLLNEGIKYQIPETHIIYGVYVLNTGIASFREVYPSQDQLDDNSLMFFEANNNSNIRMLDNIAINANEVTENQIIY